MKETQNKTDIVNIKKIINFMTGTKLTHLQIRMQSQDRNCHSELLRLLDTVLLSLSNKCYLIFSLSSTYI